MRFLSFIATIATLIGLLLTPTVARAADWSPPPLKGHVIDEANALTEQEARKLDKKLNKARRDSGFAIVVYILPNLPDGLSIEDVGYKAGNAWQVGSKTGDDGVLLIATINDRHLRIETGKGVGGALTDVGSSHINREVIGPLMKEGRVYEAMDRGVDAILKELIANTEGGGSDAGRDPTKSKRSAGERPSNYPQTPQTPPSGPASFLKIGIIIAVILGVIVLAIVSPAFREMLFWILLFGRFGGGGGGGGGRDDDDDDRGGSGYGGGGGSFGGGGSSDDY